MESEKDVINQDETVTLTTTDSFEDIKLDPKNKKLIKAAKNILKRKAITIASKQQAAEDTEELNESDLKDILSKEDVVFYHSKKQLYLEAYPELTDPFDLDDLHILIMEQIFQRNLFKQKQKSPAKDISDAYEKSIKRLDGLKKGLALRRGDRLKTKAEKKQVVNISNLSVQFASNEGVQRLQNRIIDMKGEEALLVSPDKVVE